MSERNSKKGPGQASPIHPWPLLASQVLHTFPIFSLRQDTRRSPRTGSTHSFLVLDSSDWVNVVPVTSQGNLVLIRQVRHATATIVWEIPGGMVDPEDQNPEAAAQRELLEETGYEAENFRFLGVVHPNPAILNNRCHTFLAENVSPCQAQKLDGAEDIEVLETPWNEIPKMIDQGEITHSLVLMAIFWYQRSLSGQAPPRTIPPLQKPKE